MAETTVLPIKLEPIIANIQAFVPIAEEKTLKLIDILESITEISDDDDVEYAEQALIKTRDRYNEIYALRTAITSETDALKEFLMQFEKRVSTDGKVDNHYTRVRKLIQTFKQAAVDEKNRVAKEAAEKKKKEDHKTEIESKIAKNLEQMVIDLARNFDTWSRNFFEATNEVNFDEQAKIYNGTTPKLKEETFNKAFAVTYDHSVLSETEFNSFIDGDCKFREDYSKWKEKVIQKVAPILNDWRGRIPNLKEDKLKIAKASAAERERLEKEQKEKNEAEAKQRGAQFDSMQTQANENIDQREEINKMGNSFVQQATVQEIGQTGPTKKVMRFTDDKQVPRALANIIMLCFQSPKGFQIYKTNKDKARIKNDQGEDSYVDWIQSLLDFYVSNCDALIPGTEVKEVAKVIIRK